MYDRAVESVHFPGPDGQECNKPAAETVAPPYKYRDVVTVQRELTQEH